MDHLALTVEGDRQRMTDRLFLDDLHVGQRFTSTSHVVDAEQIKRFAAEFDPQPFHLDEDAAASSMFAGLVASGWHTAALTTLARVRRSPFQDQRGPVTSYRSSAR